MLRKVEVDGCEINITASEVLSPLPPGTELFDTRIGFAAHTCALLEDPTMLRATTAIWLLGVR